MGEPSYLNTDFRATQLHGISSPYFFGVAFYLGVNFDFDFLRAILYNKIFYSNPIWRHSS